MSTLRIAISGPESSGKSALTKDLAAQYAVPWAEEFARTYLRDKQHGYTSDDLVKICEGQCLLEIRAAESADSLCFFDTDMLVLKVWAQYRFGFVPSEIAQAWEQSNYDLTLLCKPDLPWVPDKLRESPELEERKALFSIYEEELTNASRPFVIMEGTGIDRFNLAKDAVDLILANRFGSF